MRMFVRGSLLIMLLIVGIPSAVRAQSISGVAKDTSGAVLPGVTVEVTSPALIERTRTTVTDSAGRYRFIDLRVGVYSVTFTLTGFNIVKRDGIEITASFTANVNADMAVGSVSETVIVTGETPVVDITSTNSQSTMNRQVLDTIPTGRDPFAVGQLIPGVTTSAPDVGGSKGMQQPTLQVHGSSTQDNVFQQDGLVVQHVAFSGNQTGFYANDGNYQELTYQTSALTAENGQGGVVINMIPREGGNRFSGSLFGSGANSSMQSNNSSPELVAKGLVARNRIDQAYDFNVSVGGPIWRDRLWFFSSFRRWGVSTYFANTFNPDGTQALDDNRLTNITARFTAQVSKSTKFYVSFDHQDKWRGHRPGNDIAGTVFRSPEATVLQTQVRNYILMGKLYSTLSNRLLLEASVGVMPVDYNLAYQDSVQPTDIGTIDIITGVLSKAATYDTQCRGTMPSASASMSYVTGAHHLKWGVQFRKGWFQEFFRQNQNMMLRTRNGVPDSVVLYNTPVIHREDLMNETDLFLQESWTRKRLTINPGVRFEHLRYGLPAQGSPAGLWYPERAFAAQPDLVVWNNVVPRLGVTYDLTGDGKTALKFSASEYMRMEGTGNFSGVNPNGVSTDTRTWKDTNKDGIPQQSELGPSTGWSGGTTSTVDPDIKRPHQWEIVAEIDRELMPNFAIAAGYYWRHYYDLYATTNMAVPYDSYTPVTITNPLDGTPLIVYNQDPALRGKQQSVMGTYPELLSKYQGFEIKGTKRWPNRATLIAGFTVGKTEGTTTPNMNDPNGRTNWYGNVGYDSTYQVNIAGNYNLPWGIKFSGSYRRPTGQPLTRTLTISASLVPNLTQSSINVRLCPNGAYRLETYNLLDFRLAKAFKTHGTTLELQADIFNVLNANAPVGEVQVWGSSLGRPSSIVDGRLLRLGAQFRF
jgi:hypothetical protein